MIADLRWALAAWVDRMAWKICDETEAVGLHGQRRSL